MVEPLPLAGEDCIPAMAAREAGEAGTDADADEAYITGC